MKTPNTSGIPILSLALALLILSGAASIMAGNQCPEGNYLLHEMPEKWDNDTIPILPDPSSDVWWENFNDPQLMSLIKLAENKNLELSAALSRIEAARLTLLRTQGGYFPQFDVSAAWTTQRISGVTGKTHDQAMDSRYFTLGVSAQWEADIFGRIREQAKADHAGIDAARADRAAVALSISADVATTYFTLRTYQMQLEVALDHIDSQEGLLKMAEARFEAGLASALDVAQARQIVLSTKATIPGLKAMIKSQTSALATLCGVYPEQLPAEITVHSPLPDEFAGAPLGVPADLIRRRPDIVESESKLRQLAANVVMAKKDFLPTLSITGQIGTSARNAKDLFTKESFTYSVTPQLSWTIFDGLTRNRNIAIARADLEAAIDSYNYSVMQAVQEVNDDIYGYASALEQIELYKKLVKQTEETLKLSIDRYKLGITSFSDVSNTQLSWLEARNSEISARGNALNSLISIYRALGGGWSCNIK